ncbi:MAG: nucleotidyltransferase family protein [Terracidiphilus sp.]|nr:nucleotidyltransferase family protein [Terracidiphilus sp.]
MDEELTTRREFACGDVEALLLAACANGDQELVVSLYEKVGDDTAWQAACAHELESHIAHKLMHARSAERMPQRWREAHQRVAVRIGAYMDLLDEMAAALHEQGIPMIALKNAGIARGIYPCVGCCPMGDLDILVRNSDFWRAHEVLLGLGYTCSTRSFYQAGDAVAGGLEYQRETGQAGKVWLELQWRAVAGRWIQRSQEPGADDLMARSVPIDGSHARLFSPEDNLLQVCLHTAKHSYLRAPGLRLHTDVERLVRGTRIDWDVFLSLVRKLKVRTAVYLSLWLPSLLIGTPVPPYVLAELRPSAAKRRRLVRHLQQAGFFYPNVERKFTRKNYMLFCISLYDDVSSLLRAVFPDKTSMREYYGASHTLTLPYHYVRRIVDLTFRRAGF